MATSPAKIQANQLNSLKSTGPRSAEGKARACRNAMRHGLTCQDLIVRPDEQLLFDEMKSDFLNELKPAGSLETLAFNDLVRARWNMERIQRLELDLFDGQNDPLQNEATAAIADRYHRYYTRWERSYYRSLAELRRLQTDRALRAKVNTVPAELLAPLASGPKAILQTKLESMTVSGNRMREMLNAWKEQLPASAAAMGLL
jgi:hypothetical protein